jgi:NADPH-dependent curcumin reductase CurA
MVPKAYTRIVLNERPVTDITPNTFRTEVVPFDFKLQDDEILMQVTWLSLDPAMRGWLRDARSYMPPVQIGEVMRAVGLGIVVEVGSRSRFQVGDLVRAICGGFLRHSYEFWC